VSSLGNAGTVPVTGNVLIGTGLAAGWVLMPALTGLCCWGTLTIEDVLLDSTVARIAKLR